MRGFRCNQSQGHVFFFGCVLGVCLGLVFVVGEVGMTVFVIKGRQLECCVEERYL